MARLRVVDIVALGRRLGYKVTHMTRARQGAVFYFQNDKCSFTIRSRINTMTRDQWTQLIEEHAAASTASECDV